MGHSPPVNKQLLLRIDYTMTHVRLSYTDILQSLIRIMKPADFNSNIKIKKTLKSIKTYTSSYYHYTDCIKIAC